MNEGLGVLDMVTLHRAAVARATNDETSARAATFFMEALSPFEMALGGYRASNAELKRLNDSLRKQKDAVEDVNRELESFSYSVSHDLRAPLRSIDGFSQILLEEFGAKLDDDGKKYLRHVREAAQQMAMLIDDLLSLARVSRSELRRVDVDLSALVRGVAERLRASSPERNARFEIQDGVRVMGDERLLGVLVENLLGNAWKFTSKRERTEIVFTCEMQDGRLVYRVGDNGAGFDMAHAEKLFAAFQRLHAASEFEGNGVGLAIVQRVVHRHEGKVWAEGAVERGASFSFTLDTESKP